MSVQGYTMINDNDKTSITKESMSMINETMINDNDLKNKVKTNIRLDRADTVDLIANDLVKKFDNPEGRRFYCKAAWKLAPAELYNAAELAFKYGETPAKYFSWLITKKLRKLAK